MKRVFSFTQNNLLGILRIVILRSELRTRVVGHLVGVLVDRIKLPDWGGLMTKDAAFESLTSFEQLTVKEKGQTR
jgi:hypothetical protein